MSRIPNTFVTLQKKNKNQLHDTTQLTTYQPIEVAPLDFAGVALPHHPYEVDSFMGIHLHHPYLSDNRLSSLSHLRTFPLCRWRYFHRSQHSLGLFLSHLRNKMEETTGQAVLFSCSKERLLSQEEGSFGRVAEYLLWVYAWFYIAWGLNYSQPNIYCRTGMKPAEVSEAKFREFAYRYADSINSLSEETAFDGQRESQFNGMVDDGLKNRVRDAVLKGYNEIGAKEGINAPFNQHPHAKTMLFTPLSSMSGVTGSMGPFFCEFTLNGDIRPHDYPAIYAHEYAHLLGIANEGEANFYSYIVCTASSDKAVKFSGYYHIFFHVLRNVFDILGEKEGEKFLKYIRPEIIQLAKSDRNYWLSKRCKVLDAAQDFIFDLYLRGNHVAEGRKSYSGVVGLILAWESRHAK